MRPFSPWWAAIALVCAGGPFGCSDDDSGPGPQDAAVDAAIDAETVDGGGTGSLDLLVTEWVDDATQPLEAAVVALDDRYGARAEVTTGSDGVASFAGFHWGDGEITLSAYKEGHILWSIVGLTQAEWADYAVEMSGHWVGLVPEDPPGMVELHGTAQNMGSVSHNLLVCSLDSDGYHEQAGADWTLPVPAGVDQTLIAMEYDFQGYTSSGQGVQMPTVGWIIQDVAAATQNTEVVLDFAHGVDATDIHTTNGSFPVPSRADSMLRTSGVPQIKVTSLSSELVPSIGLSAHTDINTGTDVYEYDAEWLQPPGVTDPLTMYIIRDRFWTWYSLVIREQWPGTGAQTMEFLDLPGLISPPTQGTQHPRTDPLEWELYDSDVFVGLIVRKTGNDVWYVGFWKNTTGGTLPEPPSNVDVDTYLGASVLTADLQIGRMHPSGPYYEKFAKISIRILP